MIEIDRYFTMARNAHAAGRLSEAIAAYRRLLVLVPDFAGARGNLGLALLATGQAAAAAGELTRVVALDPASPGGPANLASALRALGRLGDALQASHQALAAVPTSGRQTALLWRNIGLIHLDRSVFEAATEAFRTAIALGDDGPEVQRHLATALQRQDRSREAMGVYDRLLQVRPGDALARFARCMAHLRHLYTDRGEIEQRRRDYETALRDLVAHYDGASLSERRDAADAVGSVLPFLLGYQGYNDRALQSLYGGLAARLMADRHGAACIARDHCPATGDGRLRVALVSGFFRLHSTWKMRLNGWTAHFDRRRFALYGFHTQATRDSQTALAAARCREFVQGPLSLPGWIEAIRAVDPHIILYPEIGMDATVVRLAALRLAPVQIVSWTHPVTSGLPTLDVFASNELMEPGDAQAHYSERLALLPNLSVHTTPIPLAATGAAGRRTREDFGLPATGPLLWSCQSLFKYVPENDALLARVAAAAGPTARLLFIRHHSDHVTQAFRARLERAFAQIGLEMARHCLFLPRLAPADFQAILGLVDVFLDSLGWSGCNTVLESLAAGLPVVTLPGTTMRARHALGILTRAGVTDTVAATAEDYVALVVRLIEDPAWRSDLSERLRRGQDRVFADLDSVRATEALLERETRPWQ